MGEGIMVVAIGGTAYIIKSGHNNQDMKAIEIALKRHEEKLKEEAKYYHKNDIRDENGNCIYPDYSTRVINVFDGVEI